MFSQPLPARNWLPRFRATRTWLRNTRDVQYAIGVARRVRELHRRHGFDLVEYADINYEGLFHRVLNPGIPYAVRCHTPMTVIAKSLGSDWSVYTTRFISLAERAMVRRADILSAPSLALKQRIAEEFGVAPRRIAVIPNPVDTVRFSPEGPAGERQRGVEVLCPGRLDPAKGVLVLAQAIRSFFGRNPQADVRFTFAGRNSHNIADTMRDALAADGLGAEQVRFMLDVPDEDLPAVYRGSDISVVPALIFESFSYTCAESLSCGRPVIASRNGGMPEVVLDGECGILVDRGDAEALAGALERLTLSPEMRLRYGEAGRVHAVQSFSIPVVADMLASHFALVRISP